MQLATLTRTCDFPDHATINVGTNIMPILYSLYSMGHTVYTIQYKRMKRIKKTQVRSFGI